jgi:CheY-like chemotaxis protein
MAKLAKEKFLVLLVDDAGSDCLSIQLPEAQGRHLSFMGNMSDGHDLIACLRKTAEAERVPVLLSDLLLLGLLLPRKDGFEVLRWLQSQPFEGLTVVVLQNQATPSVS